MTRRLRPGFAALALALVAGAASAQPAPDGLPEGPGKDVVVRVCTSCHDASTLFQPRTPEAWQDMIGKMMNIGAELSADEQAAVYAYLVKNFSAQPPAPSAGAPPPEKPPSRP
jgi:cytochrome c5